MNICSRSASKSIPIFVRSTLDFALALGINRPEKSTWNHRICNKLHHHRKRYMRLPQSSLFSISTNPGRSTQCERASESESESEEEKAYMNLWRIKSPHVKSAHQRQSQWGKKKVMDGKFLDEKETHPTISFLLSNRSASFRLSVLRTLRRSSSSSSPEGNKKKKKSGLT